MAILYRASGCQTKGGERGGEEGREGKISLSDPVFLVVVVVVFSVHWGERERETRTKLFHRGRELSPLISFSQQQCYTLHSRRPVRRKKHKRDCGIVLQTPPAYTVDWGNCPSFVLLYYAALENRCSSEGGRWTFFMGVKEGGIRTRHAMHRSGKKKMGEIAIPKSSCVQLIHPVIEAAWWKSWYSPKSIYSDPEIDESSRASTDRSQRVDRIRENPATMRFDCPLSPTALTHCYYWQLFERENLFCPRCIQELAVVCV